MEKQIVRNGPFQDIFAQAVRRGDTVTLAGQVSLDDSGNPVAPGDLVAQTRQAYANVRAALTAIGGTMDDIVDETVFVTDVGDVLAKIEPFCAVRAEAYGAAKPAVSQTLVQVSALVMPALVIEIKCVAHVPQT